CDECMDQKAKDQTISLNSSVNDVIAVAGEVDPFNDKNMYDICLSPRLLKTSPQDPHFYDFEYRMVALAGINDPDSTSDKERKEKMSALWKKYHQKLECKTETHIYPKGNYLRQLARADGEDAFELVLDNYGFDPNVIDNDGCTALDYINAQ